MEITKEIETSIATIKYEEGICVLTWKEDAEIDLESCMEIVEIRREIQNGKKNLLLIDQRQFWSISKEAKQYSMKKEVEDLNEAIALITGDWLPSVLVANTYISIYKPTTPTKIFKSEAKAREWLLSFK